MFEKAPFGLNEATEAAFALIQAAEQEGFNARASIAATPTPRFSATHPTFTSC